MIHSSHRDELRYAIKAIGALTLILLVILVLPVPDVLRGAASYLSLHMFLESVAIIIAALIFAVVWHMPRQQATRSLVVLGCAFLGVAIIDFSHTLSYPGMPDYVTPSGADKALTLWLAARMLAAVALLAVAIMRWRTPISQQQARMLLTVVLIMVAVLHLLVFFKPQWLPTTFIEGEGLTAFKIGTEYVLIAIYLLAAFFLLVRMRRVRTFSASDLLIAAVAMAMAEFFFTLYADFTDLYNLSGHVFKVIAYVFLYRGIVIAALHQPYARIEQLSEMVEQTPNVIVVTDLDANIQYVNQAFVHSTGYSAEEVMGKNPRVLNSGKTPLENYQSMWTNLKQGVPWRGEFINKRKNGEEYLEHALIFPMRDEKNTVTHYVAHKEDITRQREAEERLRQLSHFDQLTGLPNRTLLEENFLQLRVKCDYQQKEMLLMWIDLDNFKQVNDSLGHLVGDQMLMQIATRLQNALLNGEVLGRIGGDDFVVIMPGVDESAATLRVTELMAQVALPMQLSGQTVLPTASVGLAMYPADGKQFTVLLASAERAMYQAKEAGRNCYRFFEPGMQEHASRTLQLSSGLKMAIAQNELRLVFQPQMSLHDNRLIGAEALLRWRHPTFGDVSPADFIPLSEAIGLSVELAEWVMTQVFQQLRQWLDAGQPVTRIAINLSAVIFARLETVDRVRALLESTGLPAEYVEFELTENVAMQNPEQALATMHQLNQLGVHLAIDDFGTGYSSLSSLRYFAVHKLKIDQSFIRELHENVDDRAILEGVIHMGQSLGMQALAEGVETEEQLVTLREMGCDAIQGYYYSKPLELDDFAAFVASETHS